MPLSPLRGEGGVLLDGDPGRADQIAPRMLSAGALHIPPEDGLDLAFIRGQAIPARVQRDRSWCVGQLYQGNSERCQD